MVENVRLLFGFCTLVINTSIFTVVTTLNYSKIGKPSETDSIKSQISSKTSRGERTAQKDAIKDITSDSQVNSYIPYRWSPASITLNIYFYLFLYLYITRKTINNGPHIGVGRFRIYGGQGLEYWGEGGKGANSQRHMTSLRRLSDVNVT